MSEDGGPRSRRAARVRREIATAAVNLFEAHGFEDTTVQDVADATDYSASTVFRLFGTKEDLVLYDIGDRILSYEQMLGQPLGLADAWTKARAVVLANAEYWEASDPAFARARAQLIHDEPAVHNRYLAHCAEIETILVCALAGPDAADSNRVTEPAIIAAAIVGAWRAAFAAWISSSGTLEAHVLHGLDFVERLLDQHT